MIGRARSTGAVVAGLAATVALLGATSASAQYGSTAQNPVCMRLEAQLGMISRGGDPARVETIRRAEETLGRQQNELERWAAQARRYGCEAPSLFSIFQQQPAECRNINQQIANYRGAVSQAQADLQRAQAGDVESQRQAVVAALAQNNCGPQYQAAAAQQRGFFGGLFGGFGTQLPADQMQSSSFRTLCVRTCDGYFFPISYMTGPSRFTDDEQACQRLCPATEVQLYTHRNPGEDVAQAVSLGGKPYRSLPTAFKYRQAFDSSCSCRKPGQSWADALASVKDTTVERGDIVVTEEKSKALAAPTTDAQGRPLRQERRREAGPAAPPAMPLSATAAAESPPQATAPAQPQSGIRSVGPTFSPAPAR